MATNIIITYGPGTDREGVFEKIVDYVDIVRINMAHGNEEQWTGFLKRIKAAAKKANRKIMLLADLPGPKIRLGELAEPVKVSIGDEITLAYGKKSGKQKVIPLDYDLTKHVKAGDITYIGDGRPVLKVKNVGKEGIVCTAVEEGIISSHKGIVVKGLSTISPPTEEDLRIARLPLIKEFDLVGISFVMHPDEIVELRKASGGKRIVAKIERSIAMDNIESIANEADILMVARGDLAWDIGLEMVPVAQSRILEAGKKFGKPVVVATQMLLSMTEEPLPTRAEVSDVAHAVTDGASYVMLSEESAVGKYPVEAVTVMYQTIKNAEKYLVNK